MEIQNDKRTRVGEPSIQYDERMGFAASPRGVLRQGESAKMPRRDLPDDGVTAEHMSTKDSRNEEQLTKGEHKDKSQKVNNSEPTSREALSYRDEPALQWIQCLSHVDTRQSPGSPGNGLDAMDVLKQILEINSALHRDERIPYSLIEASQQFLVSIGSEILIYFRTMTEEPSYLTLSCTLTKAVDHHIEECLYTYTAKAVYLAKRLCWLMIKINMEQVKEPCEGVDQPATTQLTWSITRTLENLMDTYSYKCVALSSIFLKAAKSYLTVKGPTIRQNLEQQHQVGPLSITNINVPDTLWQLCEVFLHTEHLARTKEDLTHKEESLICEMDFALELCVEEHTANPHHREYSDREKEDTAASRVTTTSGPGKQEQKITRVNRGQTRRC
jgi:hypothetical protein